MINERIALVMLDGEIHDSANYRRHSRELYPRIQGFAYSSKKGMQSGTISKRIEPFLPQELRILYGKMQYASGM
jgi:hypothetical protein